MQTRVRTRDKQFNYEDCQYVKEQDPPEDTLLMAFGIFRAGSSYFPRQPHRQFRYLKRKASRYENDEDTHDPARERSVIDGAVFKAYRFAAHNADDH